MNKTQSTPKNIKEYIIEEVLTQLRKNEGEIYSLKKKQCCRACGMLFYKDENGILVEDQEKEECGRCFCPVCSRGCLIACQKCGINSVCFKCAQGKFFSTCYECREYEKVDLRLFGHSEEDYNSELEEESESSEV